MARRSLDTSLDPSSKNPWDALFSSTTRPRSLSTSIISSTNDGRTHPNVDDDASSSPSTLAGGYTILIQHSITSQSQRDFAFSSTGNEGAVQHAVTRSMGALSISRPSQPSSRGRRSQASSFGERFGMSGAFLARKAFEELCCRCDGSVIFVTLLGNGGVVDLESFNEYNDDLYHESGDDDDAHDYDCRNKEKNEINRRKRAVQLFRRFGAIVDLASDPFGWAEESADDSCDRFVTKSTMNSLQTIADVIRATAVRVEGYREILQGESSSQKQSGRRPIPVIFDSLTPLLSLHGVNNVVLLLESFKQITSSRPSVLSPIVAPVLYESMRSSDHRLLEDVADALLTLRLVNIKGQTNEITSGVLELVRRGGGGNGLGGKLIQECVPVRIMESSEYALGIGQKFDARDTCYWILDYSNDSSQKKQLPNVHGDIPKKSGDGEVKQRQENGQLSSRPRIYIEDDDPEFDDMDEEDPDDDLDL